MSKITLKEYLTDNEISLSDFGKRFKPPVSSVTVSYWVRGIYTPSPPNMKQFEKITGNTVSIASFY